MAQDDTLMQALREAVSKSPDNIALRKHFAELLVEQASYGDAEKEYRAILDMTPNDHAIQQALASVFMAQEKWMIALVILEKLMKESSVSPEILLMSAKSYLETGNHREASRVYQQAIQADPNIADAHLEARIDTLPVAEPQPEIRESDDNKL